MKILMLSGDLSRKHNWGGISHIRLFLPAKYLVEQGHDVIITPRFKVAEDDGRIAGWTQDGIHDDVDVIIFKAGMDERHPDLIEAARSAGQIVLMDVDDWYFGLDPRNMAFEGTHPKLNKKQNRAHFARSLNAADGLLISTPYLAERMDRYNDNIFVCRNVVDWQRYTPVDLNGDLRIGWVGSTGWRSGDLEQVRGVLGPFCERNNVRFAQVGVALGQTPAYKYAGVKPEFYDGYFAVPISQLPQALHQFNLGIVPLNDIPFNQAKSCLKGMEYASAGLPFIATPTGEYQWFHEEYGAGRLAKSPRDWRKWFKHYRDPEARKEDGARNREAIKELQEDISWEGWVDALEFFTHTDSDSMAAASS